MHNKMIFAQNGQYRLSVDI